MHERRVPTPGGDPQGGAEPVTVLFVCLGNICRSPLAEGVFRHLVHEAGLSHRFRIDSAGTGSWHVGHAPDPRASAVAQRHGIRLESRARQVRGDDFERFEHILAMDRSNLEDLRALAAVGATAQLRLLRAHDPHGGEDVPDPYYGGPEGFERVYEMVHRSCEALLHSLAREG